MKNKLLVFLTALGTIFPGYSADRSCLSKALVKKYGSPCIRNVCTDNVLCQIYTNQNMCLLTQEIPPELRNLSYVIYPTQLNAYNTARLNYNKRFTYFPHAIIRPECAEQVAYVISILRRYNLRFSLRSGGHCYGPGSLSNGYVLDLGNFNSIDLDIKNQEVFIGAGAALGEVIQKLGNYNFAIPTGTCPSVGAIGLALGGGLGLLARHFGLTSDTIKSITMINADSQIIEVTATNQYADLFFALCGAGNGSYGVVLGIKFSMKYIPEATFVKLIFNWDTAQIPQIVQAWQAWIPTLSNDVTSELSFRFQNGQPRLSVVALKSNGEPFTEWEAPFNVFQPMVSITSGTYLQCAQQAASSYTQPFSKARSKFIFTPLPDAAIDAIINYINLLQIQNAPYLFYFELGSAGGALLNGNSAYFPRSAFAWIFFFLYWNFEFQTPAALASMNLIYNALEPFTSPYSYANLVDYQLSNTFLNAYYGTNVPQLVQIKNKYDPLNIFKWHQSIPLMI